MERRLNTLAYGLEVARKCSEARTLDDAQLLLTNDLASFIEFDRAFLITHMGGRSELAAAGNTPILDAKTRFYEEAEALGGHLAGCASAILLSGKIDTDRLRQAGLTDQTIQAIQHYMEFATCSHMFVLPLNYSGAPLAHLILEYFPGRQPDHTRTVALMALAPLLAGALAQQWLVEQKPSLRGMLRPDPTARRSLARVASLALLVCGGLAATGWLLLGLPVSHIAGGEAVVVPTERHTAFCQMAGLVDRVLVREGQQVTEGQVLATLEPRDLDYRIKAAQWQLEIHKSDIALIERSAAQGNASELAKRQLVELKRQGVEEDLRYDQWQRQFLEVRAPIAGTVATKDVEGLSGKRLASGEPFCDILGAGEISVDVEVPEDRIAGVHPGLPLMVYLDADPRTGIEATVSEVAPKADAIPRLGNVFRVRAPLANPSPRLMVGMKGIGKIATETTSVWAIVSERLVRIWRHWGLTLTS